MSRVDELRERITNRLSEPDRLQFPSGWTTSTSWRRAQAAPSTVAPANPAEFDVRLGRENDETAASRHRVLFAVYEGDLVAECDCDGHHFRDWCAHVALLWWKWSREDLGVTDLDTSETYLSPPWWFSVDDAEADRTEADTSRPVAADRGVERLPSFRLFRVERLERTNRTDLGPRRTASISAFSALSNPLTRI